MKNLDLKNIDKALRINKDYLQINIGDMGNISSKKDKNINRYDNKESNSNKHDGNKPSRNTML